MKPIVLTLVAAAALISLSAPSRAQGPGGFQPSPALQAKFKAWQQWRQTHKNVDSLRQTVRGLSAIEQDPKTQLTKPQAKATLAVLNKWRVKPALTDAQALQVNKQLTASLTLPQLQKYAAATARRGGRGGGGGGFGGGRPGGGGPGGAGGPGGPRTPPDPASIPAPHDYNPLNPATLPFPRGRDRAQQEMTQLVAALQAGAR